MIFYFSAQYPAIPPIYQVPALSESELGLLHPHILPTPLAPGEIDSDSANDGEGEDVEGENDVG